MRQTLGAVLFLGLFAACSGSGGDDGAPDGGGVTPQPDSSSGQADAYSTGVDTYVPPTPTPEAGSDGPGAGGACTSLKCTSNAECQSTCGPVAGGIECCDIPTQGCFPTSAAACPPASGSGDDGGGIY
jgi:hypothetical protein